MQDIKGGPLAHEAAKWRFLPRGTCHFNPLPSTQSMRLLASDLQRMDIAQLDPEALGNIKKLSVSLALISLTGGLQ